MSTEHRRNKTFPKYVNEVTIGSRTGATVPVTVDTTKCNALIDTGAIRSVMSENFYSSLDLPQVQEVRNIDVRSASGGRIRILGYTTLKFTMGTKEYQYQFLVCKDLTRPMIIGLDFMQKFRVGTNWSSKGKFILETRGKVLVESMEVQKNGPRLYTKQDIEIPGRTIATIEVGIDPNETQMDIMEVAMNGILKDEFPNLVTVPTIHKTCPEKVKTLPFVLLNLDHESAYLETGQVIGHLQPQQATVEEITLEQDSDELSNNEEPGRRFILSPADVQVHRKVHLKDFEVSKEHKETFAEMCKEFEDIFSKDSSDIGRTPLITMEIDTGNSPPIAQRAYNLPLKHAEWVQKELQQLEDAKIITRSVSPWASPIVIVPKKTAPGEPPRRRMCVDYRALNKLLPAVQKVGSNAKGVLTLVPLPKIDEIYGRLKGSRVYSTFDMRSGYHHMGLTKEAQSKSAFVVGGPRGGKFEFKVCPFGLAQAPAYFQRLVDEVLQGLPFAFGYLDDILIFSPDIETHLEHIRILFNRLREADLKLTERKCSFFKAHVQYLGHLISGQGIEPLPEKLESIRDMPAPTTPKEVKQFLGLIGYYRKFVPRFSDIARPLTNLTKKEVEFDWTAECEQTFILLKMMLMQEPILKYPDPTKPYILYTDASKYAWACVLAQEYTHEIDGKTKKVHHPITYMSGLFKGSQLNWATLTKEAYAIYMSVRKLTYYLEDAEVTLRSDHLPLKKFLEKNTLNTKVNNWAVEISPYKITFEYIKGIKNTLADTMSRLVRIIPDAKSVPEPEGFEFGYCAFEDMEPIHVEEVQCTKSEEAIPPDHDLSWTISPVQLLKSQKNDKFCKERVNKIEKHGPKSCYPYYLEEGILKKKVTDNKQVFETIIVPRHYAVHLLKMAHDDLGHNGSPRTYMMIRRHYYWKGMKKEVYSYIKACKTCQKYNKQSVRYTAGHFSVPQAPMEFISMDLIGEFTQSKRGNKYALTVICMLTGYTFCIPITSKTAEEVVKAYVDNVYCKFGGSLKILSDNGTEFKNELFTKVANELGVEYKIYTPPYRPASNGRIEGFHYFLKTCMGKHIADQLEWDDVTPLACAAYNFMPNEHSKESPFFLMFGREARLPLTSMFNPKTRYMGNEENILSLEALKSIYLIVATNLQKARGKLNKENFPQPSKLKCGDAVLVKNFTAKAFEQRYRGDYKVVAIRGNQVEVMPSEGGKTHRVHIADVKYVLPVDGIIAKIPNYNNFGRKTNLPLPLKKIPDLKWSLSTETNTLNTPTYSVAPTVSQTTTNNKMPIFTLEIFI